MNFGNMGFMEILLILVVVLLLFGAKRLPEIGASMGKGIREFKKSISDVDRSLREPDRDARLDRDYAADRLQNSAREAQPQEERPEPKRLLS
jgi:sec-independent protein translocase protein TatA